MKKIFIRGLIASLSLVSLAACQDYDGGFNSSEIKKAEYAKDFEKTFGKIDPNQDWSMAQQVSANVNVSNTEGSTLRILSASPLQRGYQILAESKMDSNTASVTFDVVKGTSDVYVELRSAQGNKILGGYYTIIDGKVDVNTNTVVTRATTSTATVSVYTDPQALSATYYETATEYNQAKGTTLDDDAFDALSDEDKLKMPATPAGSVAMTLVNGAMLPVPKTYKSGISESDKWYYDSTNDWDFFNTNFTSYIENMNEAKTSIPKFYKLSNVAQAWSADLKYSDYYPLIQTYVSTIDGESKPGPFKEFDNHVKPYFGKNATAGEMHLEKDASILTAGGEVVITYMGGGTRCTNDIGYFYYKKGEESRFFTDGVFDITKVNKYIFCEDMANQVLMKGDYYGTPNTDIYSGHWQGMVGRINEEPDAKYKGTDFKLTWFGDEGDGTITTSSTGQYEFPKDYVIGFFGIRTDIGPAQGTMGQIDHFYTSFSSVDLNYFNTLPHGATFRYKGSVFLGVEDNNDYDINDFLFMLRGVQEDIIPDVTPEDDPDIPVTQKWLVACEDLGNTFDYDFNDLVLGFERKNDKLYLKALAACGTLPAHIFWDGADKGEIHHLCNSSVPADAESYSIISKASNGAEIELCSMSASDETSIKTMMSKLSIVVTGSGNATTYITGWDAAAPNKKEGGSTVPQMLLLPGGWDWPTEGTLITEVYPEFQAWTIDCAKTDWTESRTGSNYISNTWGGSESANVGGGSGSGDGGTDNGGSDGGSDGDIVSANGRTIEFTLGTAIANQWNNGFFYPIDLSGYSVSEGTTATIAVVEERFEISDYCLDTNWQSYNQSASQAAAFIATAFENKVFYVHVRDGEVSGKISMTFSE